MTENENVIINIDLDVLVAKICASPKALRLIAEAVRNTQTKQSRQVGNLYGNTAQRQKPQPPTRSRLS